jgi:integrase
MAFKLTDLTLASVAAFEDRPRREGRSRPMRRKILTSLRGILGEAQGRGKVQRNVVKDRPRTQTKGKSNRKRLEVGEDIPTTAEVRAIIAATSPEYRTVLLVTALTGMRASEVRGVRWCDVDLLRARFALHSALTNFTKWVRPSQRPATAPFPFPVLRCKPYESGESRVATATV